MFLLNLDGFAEKTRIFARKANLKNPNDFSMFNEEKYK